MSETMRVATDSVGTTAGIGVIAWQSYLMRKAVKVSQDALEVAQNTLAASETVAIDAARTRLDAQAPAVTARFTEVQWPPYAWSHVGMPASPWPNGYEWHFPEKENDRIVLKARVVIENRGERYINVEYVGDLVKVVEGRARPATAHALWPNQLARRAGHSPTV
ncbi:hypothetical protein [Streptomyces sp. NPDC058683]|uniref:hypothetical protein n=1 Tax=Streptomyces sp. NPDC058683 TaxID=3346597 RepID=UPI003661777F